MMATKRSVGGTKIEKLESLYAWREWYIRCRIQAGTSTNIQHSLFVFAAAVEAGLGFLAQVFFP